VKNIINQLVEMIKEAKDNSEESLSDKKHLSTLHDCYYQGWVEALNFVQTSIDGLLLDETDDDPLKVSEETQSALNKIADANLRGNYPKSLNGLFSYATVTGYDMLSAEDCNEIETDGYIEVYEVSLKFGRQDDCYNETYEDVIFVRKDNLIPVVGVDPVVK
tara:strand:- start:40 stop:525 length:486 start_codon:yes stop_codon:yes gene_type:complete